MQLYVTKQIVTSEIGVIFIVVIVFRVTMISTPITDCGPWNKLYVIVIFILITPNTITTIKTTLISRVSQ